MIIRVFCEGDHPRVECKLNVPTLQYHCSICRFVVNQETMLRELPTGVFQMITNPLGGILGRMMDVGAIDVIFRAGLDDLVVEYPRPGQIEGKED